MKLHNNIDEIILFINNDYKSYKSLLKYITAIKENRAIGPISSVVNASRKRYKEVTGISIKLTHDEIVKTAKLLINQYKDEIDLGYY